VISPGLAAAVLIAAAAGAAQVPAPVGPGQSTYVGSGGDLTKYVVLYGEPMYWSLSLLVQEPPPRERAILTRGRLVVFPKPGADPDVSVCAEDDERSCLGLRSPVPEIAKEFFTDAPFRNGHQAQVVGAFTREGFLFWSVDTAPARERGSAEGPDRRLEDLVIRPDRYVGRAVTVRGRFRGANLFGDLAGASPSKKTAWVLRDGPFSVWVTGREPRGDGWRLDVRSPEDCVWEVEVAGRVDRAGEALSIEARQVRLLGRISDAACAAKVRR
jgi:hypothetical protein